MSKELPYFQFEPAEYMAGDIQLCSLEAQGLFVNIKAIYWLRSCILTPNQISKRFKRDDLLDELIEEKIIKIENDHIIIDFLNEQFELITKRKSMLSEAGKKGALKKKQATLKPPLSDDERTLKQPYKIIVENSIKENKEDLISPQKDSELPPITTNSISSPTIIKGQQIGFPDKDGYLPEYKTTSVLSNEEVFNSFIDYTTKVAKWERMSGVKPGIFRLEREAAMSWAKNNPKRTKEIKDWGEFFGNWVNKNKNSSYKSPQAPIHNERPVRPD